MAAQAFAVRNFRGHPSPGRGRPGGVSVRGLRTALGVVALAVTVFGLVRCGPARSTDNKGLEPVTINGEAFVLELAVDEATRVNGLMGRERLNADGGMLFVFPDSAARSFWMGHCLIDIDVIFLDAGGRVTATHEMKTGPPQTPEESLADYERHMHRDFSYASGFPAQFVVELKAGSLERLDLAVEDKIILDLTRLKAMAR
jgi:uncharacterized membrane protein (UPF0127 family)